MFYLNSTEILVHISCFCGYIIVLTKICHWLRALVLGSEHLMEISI
jgi:hypothetical protein